MGRMKRKGWERFLEELLSGRIEAVLLVGPIGAGKTRTAIGMVSWLRERDVEVGGVVSPRVMRGRETVGYRVRDLVSGEERPLCSLHPPGIRFRRFYFSPEGIEFARRAILRALFAEVAVVDEIGPLELSGEGFAPAVLALRERGAPLILTVRPGLVDEVADWASLRRFGVFEIGDGDP